MEETDFGWALRQLKLGRKVCRSGWNGAGQWVILVAGSNVQLRDGTPYAEALNCNGKAQSHVTINSHVDLYNSRGEMQPGWVPSQGDMLARDWQIAS